MAIWSLGGLVMAATGSPAHQRRPAQWRQRPLLYHNPITHATSFFTTPIKNEKQPHSYPPFPPHTPPLRPVVSPSNSPGRSNARPCRTLSSEGCQPRQFTGTKQPSIHFVQPGRSCQPRQFTETKQRFIGTFRVTGSCQPQQFTGTKQQGESFFVNEASCQPRHFTGTKQQTECSSPDLRGCQPRQFAGTKQLGRGLALRSSMLSAPAFRRDEATDLRFERRIGNAIKALRV